MVQWLWCWTCILRFNGSNPGGEVSFFIIIVITIVIITIIDFVNDIALLPLI